LRKKWVNGNRTMRHQNGVPSEWRATRMVWSNRDGLIPNTPPFRASHPLERIKESTNAPGPAQRMGKPHRERHPPDKTHNGLQTDEHRLQSRIGT
jgi:hypothetical protein